MNLRENQITLSFNDINKIQINQYNFTLNETDIIKATMYKETTKSDANVFQAEPTRIYHQEVGQDN